MNSEAIIQDVVFKIATRWERMSPHRQKRYKKKHPKSEKKVMRELIPEKQTHKKVKHMKRHKLRHMKHRNKLNYDALVIT
jgi:hypothetical protein